MVKNSLGRKIKKEHISLSLQKINMKNVIEYKTVTADHNEGINYQVKNLIEEGWQPIGEMKVTTEVDEEGMTTVSFYQTMVLYAE